MSDFTDIDGKMILPGCEVLVAASRRWGGSQLIRGRVYRLGLRGSYNHPSICVEYKDAKDGRFKRRAFYNNKAMLVTK